MQLARGMYIPILLPQYSSNYQTYNNVVKNIDTCSRYHKFWEEIPTGCWATKAQVEHILEAKMHIFTDSAS